MLGRKGNLVALQSVEERKERAFFEIWFRWYILIMVCLICREKLCGIRSKNSGIAAAGEITHGFLDIILSILDDNC